MKLYMKLFIFIKKNIIGEIKYLNLLDWCKNEIIY